MIENTVTVYRKDLLPRSWEIFLDGINADKAERDKIDSVELVYSRFYAYNKDGNRPDDIANE